MVTIKDYASSRGVSYEAVRQSIKRHNKELEGHIQKKGRKTFLDNEAAEILDLYRGNTVKVVQPTEIENLEYISNLKDEIIRLQAENTELLKSRQDAIEAKVRLELMSDTTKRLESEIGALKAELSQYQRTIFGLYKKISK